MRHAGNSAYEYFKTCVTGITPIYVTSSTTDVPYPYCQGFILKRTEEEGQILLTEASGQTVYLGRILGGALTWKRVSTANQTSVDTVLSIGLKDEVFRQYSGTKNYALYIFTVKTANAMGNSIVIPSSQRDARVSVYNATSSTYDMILVDNITPTGFRYRLMESSSYQQTYGSSFMAIGISI